MLHLAAPEVKDERAPLRVPALLRVGVLVQRGAVETGQRPLVGREVTGDPVQDHADACLVQPVDQEPEVVGVPEARGGSEEAGDVVAPGATEGVLHHRQQLDVGEAGLGHVRDQAVGQVAVGLAGAPRPEVHLVDAHGLLVRQPLLAGGHPLVVAPGVDGVVHDGCRRGCLFGLPRHRVGLVVPLSVLAEDLEPVDRARGDVGHEQLPDPRRPHRPHRVRPAVPEVEVADDT
jgi:hypothetical protein